MGTLTEKQQKKARRRRLRTALAWTFIVLGSVGVVAGGAHIYVVYATEIYAEQDVAFRGVRRPGEPLPLTQYETTAMYLDGSSMILGAAFLYVGIRLRTAKRKDVWKIRQRCPMCNATNPAWRFKCRKCLEMLD